MIEMGHVEDLDFMDYPDDEDGMTDEPDIADGMVVEPVDEDGMIDEPVDDISFGEVDLTPEPVAESKTRIEETLYQIIKENGIEFLEDIPDACELISINLHESRAIKTVVKLCIEEEIFLDYSKKMVKGIRLEEVAKDLTEEIISYGFSVDIAKNVASAFVSAVNHYHTNQIGKSTCRQLKEMRKIFAEINGIDFYEKECTYDGPCQGTCPYCDAKTKELLEKASRLQKDVLYPKTEVTRRKREEIEPLPLKGSIVPDPPRRQEVIDDKGDNVTIEAGDGKCDWDIADLELSVRSYNCLQRAGIYKVSQLTKMTSEELLEIRNIGKGSFSEICKKLKELGLSPGCDN